MRLGVCAVILVGALAGPALADRDPVAARKAFDAGSQLYQRGDYVGAAAKFEAAYGLDPDPAYAFNIAQAYRFAKKCARAAYHYRDYLQRAGPRAPNADKVERYLQEVTACAMAQARELLAPASAQLCARSESASLDDPAALFDRGRCADQQGQVAAALAWYRKTHERATRAGAREIDDAALTRMAELAQRVAVIRIDGAIPSGATVNVDGAPATPAEGGRIEVDPGHHVVEVRGHRHEVDLAAGATTTVSTAGGPTPEPAPRQRSSRKLVFILGGAAVGRLAATATLGLVGKSRYDDADDDATRDRWKNIVRYAGTPMFLVGCAAVTGAVIVYVRAGPERRTTAVTPVVAPDRVGVALEGAF